MMHNCIRSRFPNGAFLPWRFVVDGEAQEVAVEGSLIATDPDLLVRAAVDGYEAIWHRHAPRFS
jgi:hypothetical protein